MSSRRIVAGVAAATLAALLLAGPAASASQGSVPTEVASYAADGLVERLDDLFGVSSSGKGIHFDDTTAVGQLNRVFVFTGEFLAGEATELPTERANLWTAPVTIADKPVGLATIWINPATVAPELADFVQDIGSATALADVPADAYLVGDEPRGAWFTLVDGTLTPLIPGSSGVTAATSLEAYQSRLVDAAAAAQAADTPSDPGTLLPVAIIASAAIAVIAALLIPLLRGRSRASKPVKPTADAATPQTPAAIEPAPAPAVEPEPLAAPAKATPKKTPSATKAPKSSATTPATTKPRSPRAPKPPVDPT